MYCTADDLVLRFGQREITQLTDYDRDDQPDGAVLDQAITDTAAEIDSYIGSRYPLPLGTVPAVLELHACDICRFRLYRDGAPEEVAERYAIAIRWLKDVAQGKAQLLPISNAAEDADEHEAEFVSRESVFGGGGY